MEKCPRCHAKRPKYTYRTRPRWTYIVVECEQCGYTGREVPIKGTGERIESAAAHAAAVAWNHDAKRPHSIKKTLH